MSKSEKLDPKELKKPDEFVSTGTRILNWVAENRTVFFTTVGIVIGLGVVVNVYQWMNGQTLEDEWGQYYQASKGEGDARWAQLAELHSKLSSGRPKYQLAVELADHYFQETKVSLEKDSKVDAELGNQAIKWYSSALEYGGLETFEKQLVLVNRGKANEMIANLDGALADFTEAEGLGGKVRGLALLQMGRVWKNKGDSKQAVTYFEKVYSEFSGTEYAKQAKNYLRLMNSPLFKKG